MSTQPLRLVDGAPSGASSPPGETITELLPWYLDAKGYAAPSRRQRTQLIRQFATKVGDPKVSDLDPWKVMDWWRAMAHLSPATRRAQHSAVSGFLTWCRAMGFPVPDVMAGIRRPSVPRTLPKVLTADELAQLERHPMTIAERLIVRLMLDAGMRAGEVARLRGEHLDHEQGVIRVKGKGGHEALIPLPRSVAEMVPDHTVGPVTPTSAEHVSAKARELLVRAGIGDHTAHSLRRTFATRLVNAGTPINVVQRALRHQSITSTAHYVGGASVADVAAAMEVVSG